MPNTKTGKMYIPNTHKRAIKYTNIFQSWAPEILSKLGFFAQKQTIWQP
jgi:hypothetical protein